VPGALSGPQSIAEQALDAVARIRASQHTLGAFAHVASDESVVEAAAGIKVSPQSPLGGLAIGVKDIIDTAQMPTRYGSVIYNDHWPAKDAEIVRLLKAAGGIVVGKTMTTQFATWVPTSVPNPHNFGHTPGGSSAGSAVSVAAGLVPVALGTQTLGSVIRPASYCGVVGFKPSFGLLPMLGVKPLAWSLDTLGLFGRSVADVRSVFECLVAGDEAPKSSSPKLAFVRGPHWAHASHDAQRAFGAAIQRLRGLSGEIPEFDLGPQFEEVVASAQVVHDFEMRQSLMPEFSRSEPLLDPTIASRIQAAAELSIQDHTRALAFLERERIRFADAAQKFDALLCLASTGEAPQGHASTGNPIMNTPWTALHAPCLTLPVLKGKSGMPIGMQIVAGKHSDAMILRVAEHLALSLPCEVGAPGSSLD
jgi:Asp-tRNA(Asn)/Glu-tRNA(Gln) amidotransferase A subunit family amidase